MAQAILEFDFHPDCHRTGFELGWDHAHHALTPPLDQLAPGSPLRQGWDAGRASFGTRTLEPTRYVRKWLQLRLNAWRRGRVFEGIQVTPNYLRQIDVDHCPITRQALTRGTGQPSDASIDRVRNDGGYAAGNLAVMSSCANTAKGRFGFDEALSQMRRSEVAALTGNAGHAGPVAYSGSADLDAVAPGASDVGLVTLPDQLDGLTAAEWARVAVLCSLVTTLPHEQAAALPLLVLPPNRLRLFNPVQALQALVTRQLDRPGWSTRIARIEALLPGKAVRRDFQVCVHALLPRVLEGGRSGTAQTSQWALEDAWRNPLVIRCWIRFACQLTAAQAEQVVLHANRLRLGQQVAQPFTQAEATEGWGLEHAGYLALPTRFQMSTATAAKVSRIKPPPPPPPRAGPGQLAQFT